MAEITLQAVEKTYAGGFKAVHGVSLEVPDGAFCVLVGPSGCGKSTLLRMVAGLEYVSSGTVAIGGKPVNDLEPGQRDIAMVFQNYALYPHMSVYDNMAYGLRNRRVPKADIERKVRDAAEILNLGEMLDRKPRQLSGGQRQRVAMGRAIVRSPQVFLFDEPLSNLDAKLRVQMRVEIKRLQRRLGVTSLYVTHDQVEAMTLSDVLVVMNAGRVEQIGSPQEIYARPASRFVATFIGSPSMNLIRGVVTEGGRLALSGTEIDAAPGLSARPGQAVEIGLRPEDMRIAPHDGPGTLPFRLEFREDLGATELLHGSIAGEAATLHLPAGSAPHRTETLSLIVAPEKLHLFDPQTGLRLG